MGAYGKRSILRAAQVAITLVLLQTRLSCALSEKYRVVRNAILFCESLSVSAVHGGVGRRVLDFTGAVVVLGVLAVLAVCVAL